jgi:ParB-like chromosome segregation protein Spo0J
VKLLGWTEIAAVVRDETDDQVYILTLVENLHRENLTPKEEAAALEVLVRERGWTTRQGGDAVKRSAMYVSRRLRVFDDPVLAPLVLADQLPVSTAEELLRESDPDTRHELAEQAVNERWERPQVRAALGRCNAALRPSAIEARIRDLTQDLESMTPNELTPRSHRDLRRLIRVAQRLISA